MLNETMWLSLSALHIHPKHTHILLNHYYEWNDNFLINTYMTAEQSSIWSHLQANYSVPTMSGYTTKFSAWKQDL